MDQFIKQINCPELFNELTQLISSYAISIGLASKFNSRVFNSSSSYDNLVDVIKEKVNNSSIIKNRILKIEEIGFQFEQREKAIMINHCNGILVIES